MSWRNAGAAASGRRPPSALAPFPSGGRTAGRSFAAAALAVGLATAAGAACVSGPVPGSDETGGSGVAGARGPGSGGTGQGSGGTGGGGPPRVVITPPPVALPAASACADGRPGPRFLRRLSSAEFAASIRELFNDPSVSVPSVFDDPDVLGFTVDSNALVVQGLGAQRLRDSAEELARWASTTKLSQLSSCNGMDATCRRQFITTFGKRAFRAPLSDERVTAYDTLFAMESTFAEGVEAVIAAMLQSPTFLYRTELGSDADLVGAGAGSTVPLTQHEIASALAYLVVGSMPDDALLAAADAGSLSSPQQLEQHTDRLLADPRSGDALMRFASGWLQLNRLQTTVKDDTVFKVTDALRADMLGETRALLLDTFATNGGVSTLLTGNHSFLNRNLAQYYGISNVAVGDGFGKVPYGPAVKRDPGLLTHASILTGHATAAQSSPSQRGKLVRTRLLCLDVPPMPNDVDTTLKPRQGATTTRQHYEQHATSAICNACHRLMDPIGFGFEHYDGFGRYRDQENGTPIDDRGTLTGMREGDVPFTGMTELTRYLASSDETKRCLVRYWSYYAYGSASWSQDACTYESIRQYAAPGGFALRDVLKGIIKAPHFARRVKAP